ncbi:MAG: phosphoribosylanthranilate isomerase [SAR202 cluster bacterium]|nr:phosphoribosylanthranilate isomerase [SAR202 cluster bacterium]
MPKVKICGIQRLEDALAAAQAGADYIGLVFVPQRRRRLSIEAAQILVQGLQQADSKVPQVVGLFAGQPLEEVNHTIQECGLDLAQLCGAEPVEYCQQVVVPVMKVVHVGNVSGAAEIPPNPPLPKRGRIVPPFLKGGAGGISDLETRLHQYRQAGCLVTLDRLVEGLQGGTGQSFDWSIAAALAQRGHQFLLAGGLTPENVAQAVAQVQPWGVDVSSGVETGGVKDPRKIREFIRNAQKSLHSPFTKGG